MRYQLSLCRFHLLSQTLLLPREAGVVEAIAEGRTLDGRVVTARRLIGVRPSWESRYVLQLVFLDLAAALVGATFAFLIRFSTVPGPHLIYVLISFGLPVVWLMVLALYRCYDARFLFVGNEEYQRVFRAAVSLLATLAIAMYALDFGVARGYLVLAVPLGLAAIGTGRFMRRHMLHRSWAMGKQLHRVLAVGHASDVADLCAMLRRSRFHGLEVVGACLPVATASARAETMTLPVPMYGTFEDVGYAAGSARVDTVIVLSCPEINGAALRRIGWSMEDDKIDLIVASRLIDVAGGRTTIRPVDGLPMLHVDHATLRGPRRLVKDAFDRVMSFLLLVLFGPLLLVLAAMIRMTSNGPALFWQVRIGRDGKPFRIAKFRTMYPGAERMVAHLADRNDNDGLLFKMRDDPRVTPVGRFLRRYSLDELPQLINVLLGHMSLVGPRPPLASEVQRYPDDMRRRLVVKPGMTGLWQVSGRSDLPWDEVMRLDLRYVENWSLSFDLVILMRTVSAVVRSSGAY
ncbi:MAG TPA: sugar transferase [Micromonosporaceae bacterium]